MYQVWSSAGDGLEAGPRFRRLEDAIRYADDNADRASFAIRDPDGEWIHVQARREAG